MITKVEIDGYKSFSNFMLDLRPFTVIAGVNGVGKSNFFDALRHLSKLVNLTFREAFEMERGSFEDLFTLYPDGMRAETISYAVELLLPASITDSFAEKFDLKYVRVRYEIEIGYDKEEGRLYLIKENLVPIKRGDDEFLKIYKDRLGILPKLTGGRNPFIETTGNVVAISQDGRSGNKRTYNAKSATRSVISTVSTVEFPHAYAVKTLLEDIRFLQLNPDKLRQPSRFMSPPYLESDGGNLASVLARIDKSNPKIFKRISLELSNIVPGAKAVIVERDEKREEYVVGIQHKDGYFIHSKLLSDGTLRILALLIVRYDMEFDGVIILEEPENGVHPGRIPHVMNLLRSTSDLVNKERNSKQVIVNTHSPKVLQSVDYFEIAMTFSIKRNSIEKGSFSATQMNFIRQALLSDKTDRIALQEFNRMLEDSVQTEAVI